MENSLLMVNVHRAIQLVQAAQMEQHVILVLMDYS